MSESIAETTAVAAQATAFVQLSEKFGKAKGPWAITLQGIKVIGKICLPPNVQQPINCTILVLQFFGVLTGALTGAPVAKTAWSVAVLIATGSQILHVVPVPELFLYSILGKLESGPFPLILLICINKE
jgi:hypothetical protein